MKIISLLLTIIFFSISFSILGQSSLEQEPLPAEERLISSECGTQGPDSVTAVNLPWFGNNQVLYDYLQDIGYNNVNYRFYGPSGPTRALRQVPVKVWVYRNDDGSGGLAEEEVQLYIYRLNELFEAAQTSIHFYLCDDIDFINNSTYYNNGTLSDFTSMSSNNRLEKALNLHIVREYEHYGEAFLPWYNINFSVIIKTFDINNPNNLPFNEQSANVLAHEVGHALGLFHTHDAGRRKNARANNGETSGCYQEVVSRTARTGIFCFSEQNRLKCEINGDFLCDTEADPGLLPTHVDPQNCSLNPMTNDSDGDPWAPNPRNFMAYGERSCWDWFSAGQIAIMLDVSSTNPTMEKNGRNITASDADIKTPRPISSHHPEVDVYEPDNFPINVSQDYLNPIRYIAQATKQHHAFHTEPDGAGGLVANDVDWIPFIAQGTATTISTSEVPGMPQPDTYIEVYDNNMNLLASNDNISATNLFSCITLSSLVAGNRYHIRVSNLSPANTPGATGHYYIGFGANQGLYTSNLTSTYNFVPLLTHQLQTLSVSNNGILAINSGLHNGLDGSAPVPAAGLFELNTSDCGDLITVNQGGTFLLGSPGATASSGHRATVTFKAGSVVNLNGGKLVINDNSRLIIEPGATLIINPNSVIELNGDNAVLDIRGDVNVTAGATFTFTTAPGYNTGYIRYDRPWYGYIGVTSTSSIVLKGQGITDKILEVTANSSFNNSDWGLTALTIEDGKVEMGENSSFTLAGNVNVNNVHFSGELNKKYLNVDLAYAHGERVRNSRFTGGVYGLTSRNWIGSDPVILRNNEFMDCQTGLRTINAHTQLINCKFEANSLNGWQADGAGPGVVDNSEFRYNGLRGIDYKTSGGTLQLSQSLFYGQGISGIQFYGSGILTGSCSEFRYNLKGIEANYYAYLDLSDNSYMQLHNYEDNIVFAEGGGLDFQNGQNTFSCEDINYYYNANGDPIKTAGIRGILVQEVFDTYSGAGYQYHNPTRIYNSNQNLWNKLQMAPVSKVSVPSYDRFDYDIYSIGGYGPHPPLPAYTLTDSNPLDPALLSTYCNTGGGGASIAATSNNTSTNTNSVSLRTATGNVASQIQNLEKAIRGAKVARRRNNASGNDMQAFTTLYAALDTISPDTTRRLNELYAKGYKLMRDIYSDALITDSSNNQQLKLNMVNNITNKILSTYIDPSDNIRLFYAHMNNVSDSYAAGDLAKARISLSKATNYVATSSNSGYAQYWDCLINATQQLQDSSITLMDAFAQLDACTIDNTPETRKRNDAATVEEKPAALQLYPNPTSDKVTVEYEMAQDDAVTIELLDTQGRVIKTYLKQAEKRSGVHEEALDVSSQLSGLYMIRVYGNKFNQTARLVIVK